MDTIPTSAELQSGPPRAARTRAQSSFQLITLVQNARVAMRRGRSVESIIKPLATWTVLVTQRMPVGADAMTKLKWSRVRTTALDFLDGQVPGEHTLIEFLNWASAALQRSGVGSTMDGHLPAAPLRFYGERAPEHKEAAQAAPKPLLSPETLSIIEEAMSFYGNESVEVLEMAAQPHLLTQLVIDKHLGVLAAIKAARVELAQLGQG